MMPIAPEDAARRNLLLLVQLRWLAVAGQLTTILAVHLGLRVALPLAPMLATLAVLALLNVTVLVVRVRRPVTNGQLFAGLLVDVACLTVQLYLSGGATNPFVSLYLLQVVLGAILLEAWSTWALVALTSATFGALALLAPPLALPGRFASALSVPYVLSSWVNYTLTAVLLVMFVTRIMRNLRDRDDRLAALRQRAAEEEHIVRMGLLASGAAHELGTPLASLSIALGDWRAEPAVARDPQLAQDVADMQAEVARCKQIVAGILFAAGEVSGDAPARTTLRTFVDDLLDRWGNAALARVDDRLSADVPIVADRALGQALLNLLDNAVEAGAGRITLRIAREGGMLSLAVRDDGRGFPAAILARIGQPYSSTKQRQGAGLGLFLAHNVLRTLGGTLSARNQVTGGAEVLLCVPVASLALEKDR
jgi:two-component system sensor histidine kinase RegB